MGSIDVTIIIPAYGPQHLLDACLASLVVDDEEHDILVVDNGTAYPIPDGISVIRNPENLGYGVACNMGVEAVQTKIICFLNVDTYVTPGWMTPLVEALNRPNVVATGPKLLYPDGRIQCAGIVVHKMGGHNRLNDEPSGLAPGVTGACMMVKREIFIQSGMHDESFWNGFEDVDVCLTLTTMGYDIWYENSSIVYHHESAAGGGERWSRSQHNTDYLRAKWAHLPEGVIDGANRGMHPSRATTEL